MYEVEQKVRADLEPVRGALLDRSAARTAVLDQRDVYFDHPSRAFAETDEALRLRAETPQGDSAEKTVRLTYKGPKLHADTKTREEVETTVEAFEATKAILEELGFTPVATVEKRRETYTVEGYHVCLDDVNRLGEFVEVEGQSERGDVEAVDRETRAVLADLGLDPSETITASYLEMLLESDAE